LTEERQQKIALIGAAEPRYESREVRVECFPWNRLKKLTNLVDYDVVILNLLSITDQTLQDIETFDSVLNEKSMLEVLFSKSQKRPNGAFVVLGDPRCSFTRMITPIPGSAVPARSRKIEIPFLKWTGMEFSWDNRPGDTIERGGSNGG